MAKNKVKKFTVKSYKTIKGRQLFFIKSKAFIRACYFNRSLRLFQYKSDDPRNKSCSIKYKYSIENLKQAEKNVTKEKTKKKKIWSWIFLALNIVVVVGICWYQFATGEAISIGELFTLDANWGFMALALLMVVCAMLIETAKSFHLIYITTHRIRPFLSYKSTALCRYYDSITPMSSGGEPFQIYYLKKRGIRGEVATSIPIVKSLFWQISNTFLCAVLLIFNSKAYIGGNPLVITLAWISVGANLIVLLSILMLSISKRVGPKIVIGILKLLSKMKIIKNYQLTFRKVMRFVINYQNCMRSFASNIFTVIIQVVLALGELLVTALIPYFIYRIFATGPDLIPATDIITKTIICTIVSLFIPIPGGSGVAEFSFLAMFSSLFDSGTLVWAMLIWRILTYYVHIFRGVTITIYDTVYGNKKADALVQSGYFNEKIHFAMIRRKRKKSTKEKLREQKLIDEQTKTESLSQNQSDNINVFNEKNELSNTESNEKKVNKVDIKKLNKTKKIKQTSTKNIDETQPVESEINYTEIKNEGNEQTVKNTKKVKNNDKNHKKSAK